jgi:hypothetical protein
LQLWVEQVTAGTGVQSVNVTYTKDDGTAGRSTGTQAAAAAAIVARSWQLPLQAGDAGIQKVDNVVGSVATVGTFNLLILRPLWSGRVQIVNGGDTHDFLKTGLAQVFADSALYVQVAPDAAQTGVLEMQIEIANYA